MDYLVMIRPSLTVVSILALVSYTKVWYLTDRVKALEREIK